jgi:hypothetical protein
MTLKGRGRASLTIFYGLGRGRNYSGFSGRRTARGQFETFVALI